MLFRSEVTYKGKRTINLDSRGTVYLSKTMSIELGILGGGRNHIYHWVVYFRNRIQEKDINISRTGWKWEMGIVKKLFNSTRKPEGLLGELMVKSMNKGHAAVSDWGMEHITKLHPSKIIDLGQRAKNL